MEWVAPLNESNQEDKRTALLAVKCVHETQDSEITKAAAQKLDGGGESGFNLRRSNIEPMDCRGLFGLLIHVQNLTVLNLPGNHISDQGVHELCKLLRKVRLDELNIANNLITNDGIEELCDVMVEEESDLRHLNVSVNRFTDEGLGMLCKALKHANCVLTSLDVRIFGDRVSYGGVLSPAGREYICDALKHENCRLVELRVLWPFIFVESSGKRAEGFEDIRDLCDALRHRNCKLERLDLGWHGSSGEYGGRREQLEKASHVPGFRCDSYYSTGTGKSPSSYGT